MILHTLYSFHILDSIYFMLGELVYDTYNTTCSRYRMWRQLFLLFWHAFRCFLLNPPRPTFLFLETNNDPTLLFTRRAIFKRPHLIDDSLWLLCFCSCERVAWIEERRFWKAELTFGVVGFFSGLVVYIRRKQLDHKMYQRIQRQIANSP